MAGRSRQAIYDALADSGKPMSLYEVMFATGIGGWDAAQELKAMVLDGVTLVVPDAATLYRLRLPAGDVGKST